MSKQAGSALESNGLADLASFIADTPDEESMEQEEAQTAEETTSEEADTVDAASDEQDDTPEDAPEDNPEEPEEDPAPVEKITFKVKGEDGKEETVEATAEEISKSWMRQQDYTKKTQALAAREDEAVKVLAQKHEEIRNQYLSQAELTRAAIVNMAGIKSEAEMAQLAQTDPASWVAENQRQQSIGNYLNQLDQQIKGEKQKAQAEAEQMQQKQHAQMFETAWQELTKEGIDKPKLQKIYGEVSKSYGFSDQELGSVLDHRMVKVMKDAVAYRELKAKQPLVKKQIESAPRMPSRQAAPAKERLDKALDNKFKSGRAKLNDLAAYLR